jgi:hypothetical protein
MARSPVLLIRCTDSTMIYSMCVQTASQIKDEMNQINNGTGRQINDVIER